MIFVFCSSIKDGECHNSRVFRKMKPLKGMGGFSVYLIFIQLDYILIRHYWVGGRGCKVPLHVVDFEIRL